MFKPLIRSTVPLIKASACKARSSQLKTVLVCHFNRSRDRSFLFYHVPVKSSNPVLLPSLHLLLFAQALLLLDILLANLCGPELTLLTFPPRFVVAMIRNFSTQTINSFYLQHKTSENEEIVTGEEQVHAFKTETKRLLDIVANSLYSEKEIFVRELISNAADALEKLRQTQTIDSDVDSGKPLEIRIDLDREKNQFIIQDFGIGMNLEELNANLGTIASSGSKKFLEKMEKDGSSAKENIIGQFGVGFYSTVK